MTDQTMPAEGDDDEQLERVADEVTGVHGLQCGGLSGTRCAGSRGSRVHEQRRTARPGRRC